MTTKLKLSSIYTGLRQKLQKKNESQLPLSNTANDSHYSLSNLVAVIVFSKLCFFILIYLSLNLLPFDKGSYYANFHYQNDVTEKITAFKTWDGHHYHSIAENGYRPNHMANAFYPLYPMMMSALSPLIGGNTIAAGIIVSNLCSLFGFIFLFLTFKHIFNREVAFKGTLLMLAFPTAFYANILYSEGLFILLAGAFFYFLHQRRYGWLYLVAFLLPLSRPQGLLMVVPLGFYIAITHRWHIWQMMTSRLNTLFVFFALGFGYLLLIMHLQTGDFLSGFKAQSHFISNNSIAHLFDLSDWFNRNFVDIKLSVHGFTNSIIDRVFFFIFLLLLYPIWRTQHKAFFVYAVITGLIPALSGNFMSFARYTFIIFPMFFALAYYFKKQWYFLLILFIPIQTLFAVRHCLNYWQG